VTSASPTLGVRFNEDERAGGKATARTSTTGRGRPARTRGSAPLDRLGDSIDAAQHALKDLRGELSKGGRDLLKDLDALLRDARKNLRRARRTLTKDLEQVQRAAAGKRRPSPKRAPPKRSVQARRTATKRAGGAAARKSAARGSGAERASK
jgi:hypothetical protein